MQGLSFSDARGVLLGSVGDAVERVRRLYSLDGKTVSPAPWWERFGTAIAIRPQDFFAEDGAASFVDVLVPTPRPWEERLFEEGAFNRFLLYLALVGMLVVREYFFSHSAWKWCVLFVYLIFSPSIHFLLDTGSADWKKRKKNRPLFTLWFAFRESVPCAFVCFCFEMIAHRQWIRSGKSWLASQNEESHLRALYEEAALAYRLRVKEQKMLHERIYKNYQDRVLAGMKLAGVFANIPSGVLERARNWLYDVYEVCLPQETARAEQELAEVDGLISHLLIARTADNVDRRSRLPALEAALHVRVGKLDDIIRSLDADPNSAFPMKLPNLPPKPEVVHLVSLP